MKKAINKIKNIFQKKEEYVKIKKLSFLISELRKQDIKVIWK